jgi:hypothetical protein
VNILGIDPGILGGLVLLSNDKKILLKTTMPTLDRAIDRAAVMEFMTECKSFGQLHVYLERAVSYGMLPASAFSYGRNFAVLEICISDCALPVTYIEPHKWTKLVCEGIDMDLRPKIRSLIAQGRLFPGAELRISEQGKKQHDGLVDALLIAEYGRRQSA